MKRKINWIWINGMFLAMGVLGMYYHVVPAFRLFQFWLWIYVFVLSLVGIIANRYNRGSEDIDIKIRELIKTAKKHGRSMPKYIDIPFDLTIISLCVAYGHWIMGIGWLWQMVMEDKLYEKVEGDR